ncbi:MAG: L,D-transpeptidase [Opitutaceae bacterium]
MRILLCLFRGSLALLIANVCSEGRLIAATTTNGSQEVLRVATPADSQLRPTLMGEQPENVFPIVRSDLEIQIALAREGFSSGSIDGIRGAQTVAALKAFQEREQLAPSGDFDEPTQARLVLRPPALGRVIVSKEDLARLQLLPVTWLGKSEQKTLEYETILELLAERSHASPSLLRRLNPGVDWNQVTAETSLIVPAVELSSVPGKAARLYIRLAEHVLEARSADGRLIAHFPVSIARMAEKRPEGELRVTVVIPDPNYTFDPAVFPESEEGRHLARKLVLPAGPNNPVGVAWIGLDRAGYGIHGTPLPELIGRTESHGCFRLANWDAQALLKLAWAGMPLLVEP